MSFEGDEFPKDDTDRNPYKTPNMTESDPALLERTREMEAITYLTIVWVAGNALVDLWRMFNRQ